MKFYVDNKLLLRTEESKDALLKVCFRSGILESIEEPIQILFGWPSLLEYLDLHSLFEKLPKFDDQNQLFSTIIRALTENAQPDLLMRMFDYLFAECLTHLKAVPEIHPTFLLEQIQEKRKGLTHSEELFSSSLDRYESLLIEEPYNTIHDLFLYLAWDRVCVNIAILFEYVTPDQKTLNGLHVFRECLIESFQHIREQGKSVPGFFRLIEALYAYEMREENLQKHPEADWLILCQSSIALRPREDLCDIYYIDSALNDREKMQSLIEEKGVLRVFTMDSADKVKASLALTNYFIDKLEREITGWRYALGSLEVICLKESEEALSVDTIVKQ